MRVDEFFIPENDLDYVTDDSYRQVASLISLQEANARVIYNSTYIIDYYRKNFLYVSENPIFLCGRHPKEVKEMGYAFYFEHVPENEIPMLLEINRAGFAFFNNTPVENRLKLSISYDFHLLNGKNRILVNHKLTPVMLAKNGHIWLALCTVSLSSHKQPGQIEARISGENGYLTYSTDSHTWERKDGIMLTDREKDILLLSGQGYTVEEIADKIYFSAGTVKADKQKLFEKLGVKNISEAITYATVYKMI